MRRINISIEKWTKDMKEQLNKGSESVKVASNSLEFP